MRDTDTDDLVSIATHLTREEVETVRSSLTAMNIDHVINEYHAASLYNSFYYGIELKKTDMRSAKHVLGKMKAKAFIESWRCPRCKTLGYTEVEKGFWEKVFYYGTTLAQCQKCKTKYSI